jgi:hypothetical protein
MGPPRTFFEHMIPTILVCLNLRNFRGTMRRSWPAWRSLLRCSIATSRAPWRYGSTSWPVLSIIHISRVEQLPAGDFGVISSTCDTFSCHLGRGNPQTPPTFGPLGFRDFAEVSCPCSRRGSQIVLDQGICGLCKGCLLTTRQLFGGLRAPQSIELES